MSNLAVVYATKTRHSAKLAKGVAQSLGVQAQNVLETPMLAGVDLLILVGGVYGGESLPEMLTFVRSLQPGAVDRVALVTTCASKKQGQQAVRALLEEQSIPVAGEWIGAGSFLVMNMGHPNSADVEAAASFARTLAEGEIK